MILKTGAIGGARYAHFSQTPHIITVIVNHAYDLLLQMLAYVPQQIAF